MTYEMKFKDFIHYVSAIDRLSICKFETSEYENYAYKQDIPKGKYDDYYVFGVGMIESEFEYNDETASLTTPERSNKGQLINKNNCVFLPCMEITISEHSRQHYDEHYLTSFGIKNQETHNCIC